MIFSQDLPVSHVTVTESDRVTNVLWLSHSSCPSEPGMHQTLNLGEPTRIRAITQGLGGICSASGGRMLKEAVINHIWVPNRKAVLKSRKVASTGCLRTFLLCQLLWILPWRSFACFPSKRIGTMEPFWGSFVRNQFLKFNDGKIYRNIAASKPRYIFLPRQRPPFYRMQEVIHSFLQGRKLLKSRHPQSVGRIELILR